MRENRLVGKPGNHAIAILPGHIFGSEHCFDERIGCGKRLQVTERKLGMIKSATNDSQAQSFVRNLVGAKDFCALDFSPPIPANESLPNRGARQWRGCRGFSCRGTEYGINNLSISGAAAKHSTQRVRHVGFGWSRAAFQESCGGD